MSDECHHLYGTVTGGRKWPLDPDRHPGTLATLRHAQDNNRLHQRLHQLAGFVQGMSNSLQYRTDVTTDADGDRVSRHQETSLQVSRICAGHDGDFVQCLSMSN